MVLGNVSRLAHGLDVRVGRGTALMFHNAFSTPCSNISLSLLSSAMYYVFSHTNDIEADFYSKLCRIPVALKRQWVTQKKDFMENKTKWRWTQADCIFTINRHIAMRSLIIIHLIFEDTTGGGVQLHCFVIQ